MPCFLRTQHKCSTSMLLPPLHRPLRQRLRPRMLQSLLLLLLCPNCFAGGKSPTIVLPKVVIMTLLSITAVKTTALQFRTSPLSSLLSGRILSLSAPEISPNLPKSISISVACTVEIHHCASSTRAKELLQTHPDEFFRAIVVDESIWNFKDQEEGAHLFNWCVSRRMMPYRMVLSRDGTVHADHAYKNGADIIVDSIAHLKQAYQTLTTRIPQLRMACNSDRISPLERRKERLKTLSRLVGPNVLTKRMDQHVSQIHRFQDQYATLTMMMPQPQPPREPTIRVIHISDTHNLHEHIDLPRGDILVHTGDIAGNYIHKGHNMSLVDQLQSFLEWLERVALPHYEKVIFIAGNHDTYLDPAKCTTPLDYKRAMDLIADYTSKHESRLHYLCHSSISHRGLLIYGCPTTICRVEGQARVTVSNGFERTIQQRHDDWQAIPRDVDILLTHLPPAGIGLSHVQDSCPMLTNHVYKTDRSSRPKLHCFGHEHTQFGVAVHEETILSNACQERLIRVDWNGGALPIVIDIVGVGGDVDSH